MAQSFRLQRIVFKNQRLFLVFPDPEKDKYFYNHVFNPLLAQLDASGSRFVIKESKAGRLRAIVQEVPDLEAGAVIMKSLIDASIPAVSEDI
jgi:hypothetical protein